ncbi:MAG: hypothetical protein U9R42_04945 [Bacteroidota bacterium]|nr:hypothetical protein [Bacteroidota bacterium]
MKKLKITSCFIIFLLFLSCETKSQIKNDTISQNSIHFEILGTGGYFSLSYERIIFNKNKFALGLKTGMGTYNIFDYKSNFNPDIIVPILFSGLYGKNHKIEFGLGQTVSNIVRANYSDSESERLTQFHSNFTLGYRYQKNKGGFIFRINYSPIIEFNKYFRHWGGISIGYAF